MYHSQTAAFSSTTRNKSLVSFVFSGCVFLNGLLRGVGYDGLTVCLVLPTDWRLVLHPTTAKSRAKLYDETGDPTSFS